MPKIRVQTAEEVERFFALPRRRAVREEERRPYREAVSQLGTGKTGGIIELEEGENPRLVMLRMHRAAHDAGLYLRFQLSPSHRRGPAADEQAREFWGSPDLRRACADQ